MLSPAHSKSNMKTKTQRLTSYNSFKMGSSTAIKAHPAKQGNGSKFELPMLSHTRSSSKQGTTGQQSTVFNSTSKVKEPQMMICKSGTANMAMTQSHNFLPAKQVVNGSIQTVACTAASSTPVSLSASKQGSLS